MKRSLNIASHATSSGMTKLNRVSVLCEPWMQPDPPVVTLKEPEPPRHIKGPLSEREAAAKLEARRARHEEVRALNEAGMSISEIGKATGLHTNTVTYCLIDLGLRAKRVKRFGGAR